MYRASESDILYGVEFAGLYVSVFTMVTGIVSMLTIRKHASPRVRMCCFASDIIMTTFLAIQTFAMCCASGAMLAFYTISWDTVLGFVNRVSAAANLNLAVGTSTTTLAPTLMPSFVQAELQQDHNLLIGLRCILFVLYFVLFASSVIGSCLSCCNYCKCWAGTGRPTPHGSPQPQVGHHHPGSTTHISAITTAGPHGVTKEVEKIVIPETEPVAAEAGEKSGHKKHHKKHKS
ncbi:hypothetical protein RvY_06640-2 [Ramazzottius varieornatus]|nr:hypothetical protein RvY_06640-2 [Ramazzottius varieornatus]